MLVVQDGSGNSASDTVAVTVIEDPLTTETIAPEERAMMPFILGVSVVIAVVIVLLIIYIKKR